MVKTLVISVLLVAIAIVALGVKVFFTKGGKFPSGHAHDIEARRRQAREKASQNKRRVADIIMPLVHNHNEKIIH